MLEERDRDQDDLFVGGSLSALVPDDYILKRVNRVLDLSWVRARVQGHYNLSQGRPGIDPEVALRLMLVGFFLGIVHDRKLMREAQMHIGIRWFIGYKLHEKLPNHSSLTRIRARWGKKLFQELFDHVVKQCIDAKLVSAETVHVDSTLIDAHSNWSEFARRHAAATEAANPLPDSDAASTRTAHGKKVFGYKQHTAVDSANGIIVDCHITPADTNEGNQLPEQLGRIEQTLGKSPEQLTADAGYSQASNYELLEEHQVAAHIVPQRRATGAIPPEKFKFDAKHNTLRCPRGQFMVACKPTRSRQNFRSRASICNNCPLRTQCLGPKSRVRTITIVKGFPSLLRARRRNRQSPVVARPIYQRHRWQVEGRHGEAKAHHHLGRAVRCGIDQVAIQALMTAVAMNLKRVSALLSPVFGHFRPFKSAIAGLLTLLTLLANCTAALTPAHDPDLTIFQDT
jgi:IS5 family transposase